jgi:hypothetical protein
MRVFSISHFLKLDSTNHNLPTDTYIGARLQRDHMTTYFIVTLATTLDDLILGGFDNRYDAVSFAKTVHANYVADDMTTSVKNALEVYGRDHTSGNHIGIVELSNGIPVQYTIVGDIK